MKTVAIYARVSTQEQSPEMQLIALREFAKKRGFKVFREYVDIVSGVSETREQYNQLLKDVRKPGSTRQEAKAHESEGLRFPYYRKNEFVNCDDRD